MLILLSSKHDAVVALRTSSIVPREVYVQAETQNFTLLRYNVTVITSERTFPDTSFIVRLGNLFPFNTSRLPLVGTTILGIINLILSDKSKQGPALSFFLVDISFSGLIQDEFVQQQKRNQSAG
mmetsp:Transcript_736/g.1777  ORF Transcript_736/g.1777 Transcript_736/m.1777 type:complete len:124 (+) Transcript_736:2027-2398(+)